MEFLPLPVTMMMCSMPEATHSSTTYWICGLSTTVNISLGCALVAGRKRVPSPAAGRTALRTLGCAADFCEDCFASLAIFPVISWIWAEILMFLSTVDGGREVCQSNHSPKLGMGNEYGSDFLGQTAKIAAGGSRRKTGYCASEPELRQ